MRLIDADALIAELKTQYGEELGWQCTVNMSDVGMMVEDAPTVDAVEVVRCKDCEHWIYWADEKRCSCDLHHILTNRDDFCSYGERKVSE